MRDVGANEEVRTKAQDGVIVDTPRQQLQQRHVVHIVKIAPDVEPQDEAVAPGELLCAAHSEVQTLAAPAREAVGDEMGLESRLNRRDQRVVDDTVRECGLSDDAILGVVNREIAVGRGSPPIGAKVGLQGEQVALELEVKRRLSALAVLGAASTTEGRIQAGERGQLFE